MFFLKISLLSVCRLMRVKNLDNSFNKNLRKRFFCMFKNILWVREYLVYQAYFGIFFCEKKKLIYFSIQIIIISFGI